MCRLFSFCSFILKMLNRRQCAKCDVFSFQISIKYIICVCNGNGIVGINEKKALKKSKLKLYGMSIQLKTH